MSWIIAAYCVLYVIFNIIGVRRDKSNPIPPHLKKWIEENPLGSASHPVSPPPPRKRR